jgi:hypothetical protein
VPAFPVTDGQHQEVNMADTQKVDPKNPDPTKQPAAAVESNPGPSSPDSKSRTSIAGDAAAGDKSNRAPASESGDPAVHQLLAEMDTARRNDDEDGVKAAQDRLAELGYE